MVVVNDGKGLVDPSRCNKRGGVKFGKNGCRWVLVGEELRNGLGCGEYRIDKKGAWCLLGNSPQLTQHRQENLKTAFYVYILNNILLILPYISPGPLVIKRHKRTTYFDPCTFV